MNSYQTRYARFKRNNPHVIAYRNRRWARLIAKWLIAVGVIMAIAIFAYPTSPTMLPIGVIAATILPLWCFKPWRCFKGRWLGRVESVKYEDVSENDDGSIINPRYNGRHTVTYAYFTVKDEQGKKRTFKLERKYESVYQVGDTVMRISGIDYPIDLTVRDKNVCPRCGSVFPSENERCVTIGCKMPSVELDANDP